VAGRIQNLKPWKPGQSGNPGGRPRRDFAAEIARAIFENNEEAIERAFTRELPKGNAKMFAVLAGSYEVFDRVEEMEYISESRMDMANSTP
jgi:hypothetical protein